MGSFQKVSVKFLLQTLSREVLSGSHKGKLRLGRGKHIEDPSGAFAASAEAEIIVTEDDVNLLETGAVGAFISGLEDEFMEVRGASVGMRRGVFRGVNKKDSICELSVKCDEFADRSVDFLVGMRNFSEISTHCVKI